MTELTKTDNRQPMGKIKLTDKMIMMPSLFDGTKSATSKQHYERFNLYINFQTKSGHLTDPVGEAIDLFEHTLDKTALVWFQMNRSKFKDLTMLKMMFLQRYNPWGKTKREQLQSWSILSFDPTNTDIDEHIDLINTLGDMVDQKEEAKMEMFIETMPMMIQTHLIICKYWAEVKDKAKSLKHIIQKCDPPTPKMPLMATGATIQGLYSHIAHSVDKEEGEIPQLFKGAKLKQTRGRGKPNGKPQEQRQNPPKAKEADETYTYDNPNNYYHNDNYTNPAQSQGCRPFNGKGGNQQFRGFTQRNRGQRPQYSQHQFHPRVVHFNRTVLNTATTVNPTFREIKQIATEAEAVAGVLSNLEDVVVVGPTIRVAMKLTSTSITCMTHRQSSMAHLVVYAVALIIPPSIVTKENMI